MRVRYATREQIKAAPAMQAGTVDDAEIDRALGSASRSVERLCRRRFHPEIGVRQYAWLPGFGTHELRLWVDVVAVDSITIDGDLVAPADYTLGRIDGSAAAPYDYIRFDTRPDGAVLLVTGTFGSWDEWEVVADALGTVTAQHGVLTFSDPTSLGVGDLVRIDTEYVFLTDRAFADTAVNLAAGLDASELDTQASVADGTLFRAGELLLIDAEMMRIVRIAGNVLHVERGWDDTNIAGHGAGADVYAARAFTAARGQLGSTAAAHADGSDALRFVPPALVRDLVVAETLHRLASEAAGYGTVAGFGEATVETPSGMQLEQLREEVRRAHGRTLIGAV